MEKTQIKRGRPKKENPKKERIYIRVSHKQKETIKEIAIKRNMSISELILLAINRLK